MGRSDTMAYDPSVADYRATSPRCAQGGIRLADSGLLVRPNFRI